MVRLACRPLILKLQTSRLRPHVERTPRAVPLPQALWQRRRSGCVVPPNHQLRPSASKPLGAWAHPTVPAQPRHLPPSTAMPTQMATPAQRQHLPTQTATKFEQTHTGRRGKVHQPAGRSTETATLMAVVVMTVARMRRHQPLWLQLF